MLVICMRNCFKSYVDKKKSTNVLWYYDKKKKNTQSGWEPLDSLSQDVSPLDTGVEE